MEYFEVQVIFEEEEEYEVISSKKSKIVDVVSD
jgi:hypothetical protein